MLHDSINGLFSKEYKLIDMALLLLILNLCSLILTAITTGAINNVSFYILDEIDW